MLYERFDCVTAIEGGCTQEHLRNLLSGYRNIPLDLPFALDIVLVAQAGSKVHVFNGRPEETQRFLGVYSRAGTVTDEELERLRADPALLVDFSGRLAVETAPPEWRGQGIAWGQRLAGLSKEWLSTGAFILVEPGVQEGDFSLTYSRQAPRNVSRNPANPIWAANDEAEAIRLLGADPGAKVEEMDDDEIRLMVADLTDDELLRTLPAHARAELRRMNRQERRRILAKFRAFARRKGGGQRK